MVFRLNGGGAVTPPDVFGGASSGEKRRFRVYELRFKPYRLRRERLTSRISTSSTTSARGLSFARITRSMTSTTGPVARTVMVFAVLFGITIGWIVICGMRMMLFTSCASSVASACEM